MADIIVGADAGGLPGVRVFSGKDSSLLRDFLAYDPGFRGGVRVAAGDVYGTGVADIIAGTGPGAPPEVRVFSPNGAMLEDYYAFSPAFLGGIFVAAGDIDGAGRADVIVGMGQGGAPEVQVFDGPSAAPLLDFYAYAYAGGSGSGGVQVGAADVTGTGRAAILTGAGPGQLPEVKAIDGMSVQTIDDFFAYDPGFLGGVFVG
jgi:hypothetical protein